MQRILRFKRHLRVEPFDAERVFLISERERFLLQGRSYALLAPLIDGRRTELELIQALAGRLSGPEVYYALLVLEGRGFLVEASDSLPAQVAAHWESLGIPGWLAADALRGTSLTVRALGGLDAQPLVEALRTAGLQVREEGELCVVVTPDYLAPELDAWAAEARRQGLRWIPVRPAGSESWLGPVFGSEEGPCWTCLAFRLLENRPVERFLQRRGGVLPLPPPAGLAVGTSAGLSLAALALSRWVVSGGKGVLNDHLLVFDAGTPRLEEHAVRRRPQCTVCGDGEWVKKRALQPVLLASRPKRFTDDGGHRCVNPEETFARYGHLVDPLTGIVAELRSMAGEDPVRQVYGSMFRVCPWGAAPAPEDFHRTGSGKGRTAAQARAGALSEALERYSATFQGDECRIRARFSELGQEALAPGTLLGFSEAQYRARDSVKNPRDMRTAIPLPYADTEIDWTPVWSLAHERRRYVPTAYCYLYAQVPPEEQFCHFNSNGNAAGNCLEEATLQGFLELVERDAVAVWWYNRLIRPGVDLESFGQPYFASLQEHFQWLGLRLWVLDITHDFGIPTFVALAWARETGRLWAGCGCHFEARLAVQRALTEVSQCINPKDLSKSPWDTSALTEPAYLFPSGAAPARRQGDFPFVQRSDLLEDVRACVDLASRAGLETLVLDQTRPDVGMSAVKVIVPGLRHFWPRFGPGRLYDVPARMGWLEAPLTEAQLNPIPFYF